MQDQQSVQPSAPFRYRTIVADPPWQRSGAGRPLTSGNRIRMTMAELLTAPVSALAHADAYLWMWCTNPTLRSAYQVLEAWDFTPRAPLTWIKACPGLDTHLRSRTEHLILGTRGHADIHTHQQLTWMFAPTQVHGGRSDEEYALIERLSPGPYLGLFTNHTRTGWDICQDLTFTR